MITKIKFLTIIFTFLLFASGTAGAFTSVERHTVRARAVFGDAQHFTINLNPQTVFVYNYQPFDIAGIINHTADPVITNIVVVLEGSHSSNFDTIIFSESLPVNSNFSVPVTVPTGPNTFWYRVRITYLFNGVPHTQTGTVFRVDNPTIYLTHITRVSPVINVLFTQGNIAHAPDASSIIRVEFEYEFLDASDTVVDSGLGENFRMSASAGGNIAFEHQRPFDVPAGTYSMRYRARAVFEGGTGDRIKYSQWRMADVYQFVSDSDMVSNTLTLRRYHSRLQDSRASFPSGASLPTGITFTEIAPQNVPSGGIVGIRHYRISSDTVDISNIPINLILSHGHIEPAADYEIRVLGHDGVWVSLGGVNDNADRTVRLNGFTGQSLNAAAAQAVAQGRLRGAGINALSSNENDWYFGIFRSAPTTDGSFRPDNRIAIVGRTSIRFGTDENQHNIQRVRIFNTNGRQVAELRQAPFIWDGRNVPSGTYVYQIRANGRTISGTVAVAR